MQTPTIIWNWIRQNLAGLLVGAVLGYLVNVLVAFQFQRTPQLRCEVLSLERVELDDCAEARLLDQHFLELLKDNKFLLSSLQLCVSNCGSGAIRAADYATHNPLHVKIQSGIVASEPHVFGLSASRLSEPRISYLEAVALTSEGKGEPQPEEDSAALREHFSGSQSIPPGAAKAIVQLVEEGVMRLEGIYSEPIWNIDLPAASLNPGDSYIVECLVIHKDTPSVSFSGRVADTEIVFTNALQVE